jgi:hypothetical protein
MGGLELLALRHPILRLLAVVGVAAFAPAVASAATPDPSPPAAATPQGGGPRPDAAPSARALAQPARLTGTTTTPVRRVVVVPIAPRVVRVATPAPAAVRPVKQGRVVAPKPTRTKAKPVPVPVSVPKPTSKPVVVRIAGEPREAIVRAVVARTADPVPLLLAAAGLAGVALAGGGVALAVGRELRAL